MPLILFNFPQISLKGYVVQKVLNNKKLKTISFRYNDADFLTARTKAIAKAFEIREEFKLAGLWNQQNYWRLPLYLEFIESRPEDSSCPVTKRIYLLDGSVTTCQQLMQLDLESAYLLGAKKEFPTVELDCGELTFVAVNQHLLDIVNFFPLPTCSEG